MYDVPINTSFAALVVLAAFENDYKILLLKRSKEAYWCHIAGRIEKNEAAWQTVVRELMEETSVKTNTLYSASYIDRFYEHQHNRINLVPVFVAYVDSDVTIQLNDEHTEYRWCSIDEAIELVDFPNMKNLYAFIWRHFVDSRPRFPPIDLTVQGG